MVSAANDNKIESLESKLRVLSAMIEKMEAELDDAGGTRKQALLKLIGMGQRRLAELKRTFH